MLPVIDCENLQQYFKHTEFDNIDVTKYRGTINYVEGICNTNKKFYIQLVDDENITVCVDGLKKYIKLDEDNYPLDYEDIRR